MFKLKEDLTTYGKLAAAMLLALALVGCGSGGGADNILCGGDPCSTSTDEDDSTDEIDNIEDQGIPDSIEFSSAVPAQVSIQGAGGDETSVVTFIVTDTAGDPISDVEVSFELASSAGGVSLANVSDTTNVNGEASTILQAGTVATSVRVTAIVTNLANETVSDVIPISTGVADFNSFDLATDTCYPHAWDYVGNTVNVTARSGDVFNNPSPDGTQVSFFTEGGQVQASCILSDGGCSVTWTGQEPLPTEGVRWGRSALLAVMTGAESFTDVNSNGVFDDGDLFDISSGYFGVEAQDDRPEPWLDNNESGFYELGEFFVDFNGNETWDDANGMYDGPLCEHSSLCSGENTIAIGKTGRLIMAGGVPEIISSTLPNPITANGTNYTIIFGDENGGALPAGTTISIATDNGELLTVGNQDVIDCGEGEPTVVNVAVAGDGDSSTGALTVVVSAPTLEVTWTWTVND